MSLRPDQVIASFDSASVLHAATVAALEQRRFPHLGNPPLTAALVRAAGRLPWPLLREIYRRIGGAEGVDPRRLGEVDLQEVAASFADAYPDRRYPAVVLGASNGAIAHLASTMQVPWLPGTLLVPVARVADPDRADLALDFGREVAPRLLDANPGVALHQMHDAAQDELMVARMTYFRVKWRRLPDAYLRFLQRRLEPGAPVVLIDDRSRWPVTQGVRGSGPRRRHAGRNGSSLGAPRPFSGSAYGAGACGAGAEGAGAEGAGAEGAGARGAEPDHGGGHPVRSAAAPDRTASHSDAAAAGSWRMRAARPPRSRAAGRAVIRRRSG